MEYFSEDEQMKILWEFYLFDRNKMHEKYERLVEQYQS
jgi:hypothetical protein